MRKYKSRKVISHEVYAVYDENEVIIYIGSGSHNRHKHCESGCSHVYELNKMHFSGEVVTTKVLRVNLTKEESIEIEKKLILLNRPRLNKQFMDSDTRKISMNEGKLLKERLLNFVRQMDKRNPLLTRFHNQIVDFIDTYKVQGLIQGIKVTHRIMEKLRGKGSESNRFKYFNNIFEYNSGILKLRESVTEVLNAKED